MTDTVVRCLRAVQTMAYWRNSTSAFLLARRYRAETLAQMTPFRTLIDIASVRPSEGLGCAASRTLEILGYVEPGARRGDDPYRGAL